MVLCYTGVLHIVQVEEYILGISVAYQEAIVVILEEELEGPSDLDCFRIDCLLVVDIINSDE